MIFQSFNLVSTMTAAENVALSMMFAGVSKAEREQRAAQLLESMGLGGRQGHRSRELSGGEQQRVAISRALANKPRLLLADEPTGNLDTENSNIVLKMLGQSNQELGQTVLMITHNPEAARFGDRIIHMRDGHIVRPEDDPQWAPR